MAAVASCGVATACRPPPFSSISAHQRGQQRVLHVSIPYPFSRLMLCQSKLSFFETMARKRNPNISFLDLPDDNDDVSTISNADLSKNESKRKKNSSGTCSTMSEQNRASIEKEPNELQENGKPVIAGELMLKLRKPGEDYDEGHKRVIRKKRRPSSLFMKMRSEDSTNVTLLQKPEVGKPNLSSEVQSEVSSVKSMLFRRHKAQKGGYEMYLSRPVEVGLVNKPMLMDAKPQKEISLEGADALREEKKNEPTTPRRINPQNKQKVKPIMSKLAEQVDIELRKPSVMASSDCIKTSPEPEPSTLLDEENGLKLEPKLNLYEPEVQQDIDPEKKQKERLMRRFMELADIDSRRLGKKMHNREVSRHRNFQEKEQVSIEMRKPKMPPSDELKIDLETVSEADQLIEREKYGTSNITFAKDRKKVDSDLRKPDKPSDVRTDPKPKFESNSLVDPKPERETKLLMTMRRHNGEASYDVTLHKKPEFDVGVQEIGQGNDRDVASARTMEQNLERLNLSSAGTDISSENEEWKRMEQLRVTEETFMAELTSYNRAGFYATYGSLAGFIPYQHIGTRYRFYALESWLRQKGVDPALHRQKLKTTGFTSTKNVKQDLGLATENLNENLIAGEPLPSNSNLNFEDLLHEYEQEKDQFSSSFIGQLLRVRVLTADQRSKRLIFTGKPKENKDILDKKRAVMTRLKVGDMVKCQIEKFAYFGIFVQVEGVTALIPQAELLYDGTLDLLSSLAVGQILDARVHALNFNLGRIVLSLKGATSTGSLEGDFQSVVPGGRDTSFSGTLEAVQPDEEWKDVELLINELEKIEVNSVCKGSFYLSSGLAPTFQVYMAPTVDDKYRLLARSGNKVQEVLVEASMDIGEMKSAVLACTSRVA